MISNTRCFDELKEYIDNFPVIDTHDHSSFQDENVQDPFKFILSSYYGSDVRSAGGDVHWTWR